MVDLVLITVGPINVDGILNGVAFRSEYKSVRDQDRLAPFEKKNLGNFVICIAHLNRLVSLRQLFDRRRTCYDIAITLSYLLSRKI